MKIKEIGIAYDDYTAVIEHEYWHMMYDSDIGSVLTGIL